MKTFYWDKPKPIPKKIRVILWHRPENPNTRRNWETPQYQLALQPWPEGEHFPERHNAYAYQTATAMYTPPCWPDAQRYEVDAETISPMIYFGMLVVKDGVRYAEDDHGALHVLEEGDTIEPVAKGEIVVTHYPPRQE